MSECKNFWVESDAMSVEMYNAAVRSIWDPEAEDSRSYVPAMPAWDETLSLISENDRATSFAQMGFHDDMPGLSEPEDGHSEDLTMPTADDLDYRFWHSRSPFALTHSELVGDSSSMLGRQLSIQAGLSNEMRLFSDDASSAATDASSVTLPGDDLSHSQIDQEHDDHYEDTSSRHEHLCQERQSLLDMVSRMYDTLSEIEISYEALELGAHTIEHELTAKHKLCFKIDQMILGADNVNQRLKVLNNAAAELDVDVDMVNNKAMDLNYEICKIDLDAWKSKLKTHKRKSLRNLPQDYAPVPSDYIPVSPPSSKESFYGYPGLNPYPYTPDRDSMGDSPRGSYTARTSFRSYPAFPYDLPLLPAAGLQDPPLQHADWDGPSVYHDYDHSTSRYQPLIPDPGISCFDLPSPPQNSPQASPQVSPQAKRRKTRRSRSRSPLASCYQSQRPYYNSSN